MVTRPSNLAANLRREERRDEVVVAAGELGFDEGAGGPVVGDDPFGDGLLVLALVDDLLVVDRYQREAESLGEEISVRIEIGEDDLGVEVPNVFEVRSGVLHEHRGRHEHVAKQRSDRGPWPPWRMRW